MVKKKSFWLILLTVLTAVVLAFCACGLVGCSSESDDEGTKTEGDGGTGDQGTGDQGTGNQGSGSGSGDTGSGSGDTGSGSGSGDSGSGSGSGTEGGGTGDGSFTLQGIYNAYGTDFYGNIEFDADGTGYFGTYRGSSSGTKEDSFSSDISWEYVDEDETEIEAEMTIMGDNLATFPVYLHKVNDEIVAGTVYIEEINSESIFYEVSVAAALESKGTVSGSHAQLVLNYDLTGVAVIGGEVQTASWAWNTDKDGVSVTIGSSTYPTTSAVVNGEDQITQAVFGTFGDASDITFLQIGDEALLDTTVATFVSEEGYTLVLYEGYVFEVTVDNTTYTGEYNPTTYVLDYNEQEEVYTPTVTTDDDGNLVLTYAEFFGSKTNVVFTVPVVETSREDNANYQKYYNHETKGQAVAVFTGVLMTETDGVAVQANDNEYWIFLYYDGTFIAHIYEDYIYGSTDGAWTWEVDSDSQELVPTFIRNYGKANAITYHAYKNDDGSYSFHMTASVISDNQYYVYTFNMEDMPAGSFEGTMDDGTDETTYYLVLYMDGTFKAHLGSSRTSDGCWAKDEDGTFTIGKKSADYSTLPTEGYITYTFVPCTQTDNDNGTVTVDITNYGDANTFHYIVDTSIIPVGGYDMSEFDET